MTKSKSRIAILAVVIMMCLSLVLGFSFNKNTLMAYAAESGYLPKIISVGDKMVDQENDMVSLPAGIVGKEYNSGKFVTAGENDVITMKSAESGEHGHLPAGLVFNTETNEITGTPTEAGTFGVSVFCTNENGKINILAWIRIFSEGQEPKITEKEIPDKAYVGSLYSASVKVDGYNENFTIEFTGNVPDGIDTYKAGAYAYFRFTPTSAMVGNEYIFKICVKNVLGEATENCTITVANGVVAPEFITKTAPLGETEEKKYGERPVVGTSFEFWLQASGTNTKDNPIEFFVYNEDGTKPDTIQDEYALGGNLYLTKEGKIYSNNVEAVTDNQIKNLYIGVRNKNSSGNYVYNKQYFYINIVNGYVIDSFTVSPENTDIPKGGKRQFTANIKGEGFDPNKLTFTWDIWGNTDETTTIDENGVVTIGLNETGFQSGVEETLIGKLKVVVYTMIGSTREQGRKTAIITLADHIHTTSVVEAKAKTCTSDGNIKHYKCTICDSLFADAGATQNLTEADVKISAGHEYTEMVGMVASTCTTKGMQAHFRCKNCDKYFALGSLEEVTAESLEIDINPTAHDTNHVDGKNATCAETGILSHEHCSLCNKNFYSDCVTEMTDTVMEMPKNDDHELETGWTATAE